MLRSSFHRLFALTFLAVFSGVAPARADIQEYEFRLVQDTVKQGEEAIVAVNVIHKPTGKKVPEAVIFASRIDMAPDGMPMMTADLATVPASEPGLYRFKTTLAMEGNWQLSLAAKVQGETGTLQNRLVLKAAN